MQLDPEYLREHYASLSDEALAEVDRGELVAMARTIFDDEVAQRKRAPLRDTRPGKPDPMDEPVDVDDEPLEDAAEVISFPVQSSTADAPDAALNARAALEDAGIPCSLELCEIPPEKSLAPDETHRWMLMAPEKLNVRATSVLQREIDNPEFEAGWRTLLENLSDEELRAMTPQVALCGLFDRIARANRVYDEEVARRKRTNSR